MNKLFLLLPITCLLSCMSINDTSMATVQTDLSRQMPQITLQKEFALNIGGGLLSLIDIVAPNDTELSQLDGVKVAVYGVSGDFLPTDLDGITFASTLKKQNSELDWEQIVRVREADEQVWVFAGMNVRRNTLEGISVFILENAKFTVITVDGRVDKMLEMALLQGRGHRSPS